MINVSKKQLNKLLAVFMCITLLMTSVISMFIANSRTAQAAGTITVYFDTSKEGCDGTASGWKKDMSNVYYYAYKDSSNNTGGLHQMTATGEDGKDGGKLFSATFDSSYNNIIFSSKSSFPNSDDKKTQTFHMSAQDNGIYILNGTQFNDGSKVYQNMYKYGTYESVKDYAGEKYKLCNMTDTAVSFNLIYSNGTDSTTQTVTNLSARNTGYEVTIPSAGTGNTPYSQVTVQRSDSVDLKTYVFSEGKIIGNTFYYGVTQNLPSGSLGYGDGKTLCYRGDNFTSKAAVTATLYFSKDYFPAGLASLTVKTAAGTYTTSAITTEGNAGYKTTSDIVVAANEIFSIIVNDGTNNITYNLTWDDAAKNLATITGNVAYINSTRTVQSDDNVFNGHKYRTVKADFFDYQYDKFDYYVNKYDNQTATRTNEKGIAKRPYVAINEALSSSSYGNTSYPLYLGQFWLPIVTDSNVVPNASSTSSTSSQIYTASTAAKQRSGHNNDNDRYYWDTGSDGNKSYTTYFGFGNYLKNFTWVANLAYRTDAQAAGTYKPYDAVVQGLIYPTLSTNPDGSYKLMATSSEAVPYFDPSWWTSNTYNTSMKTSGGSTITAKKSDYLTHYENLPFPFFEIDSSEISFQNGYSSDRMLTNSSEKYRGTYYLFDSNKHSIHVDNNGLTITGADAEALVYDAYGDGKYSNSQPGLFPFNTTSDSNSENLHYGFGVQYTMDFYYNENGTLNGEADGIPITFTFQGDDDVWVFIDDKLVLDMGGAHKNAIGEINFNTQTTYIGAAETITSSNENYVVSSGKGEKVSSFSELGIGNLAVGKHKITMYYLERGMLNSNLYVMFNLPTALTTWELQEDTDFSEINEGFKDAVKYVSDSDVFNYAIENMGTLDEDVVGSGYKTPTYTAVSRSDSESTRTKTTSLSGGTAPSPGTTTKTIVKPKRIYLTPNSDWLSADAKFGAWMFNSSQNVYVPAKWDEDVGKWYVDYMSNYGNGIKWLRFGPDNYPSSIVYNADWNSTADLAWNKATTHNFSSAADLETKNTVKITDWSSSSWSGTLSSYTVTEPDYSGVYQTHNYDPGTDADVYYPVGNATNGVTYRLTDMFAGTKVDYDTRQFNGSGNKNVVSLQYGEWATFSKQFKKGSYMRVTQLDELSAPSGNSRISAYNDRTDRLASHYYNTYTQPGGSDAANDKYFAGVYDGDDVRNINAAHTSTMYGSVTNYHGSSNVHLETSTSSASKTYSTSGVIKSTSTSATTTTHAFVDPSYVDNPYAHARQVIVNSAKGFDLTVRKSLENGDADYSQTFTFNIEFDTVFGDDDGDDLMKIQNVPYMKYVYDSTNDSWSEETGTLAKVNNSTGRFTLGSNDYIVIMGIPVDTHYSITEEYNKQYKLDTANSINLSGTMSDNITAQAYNKRKTGDVEVEKTVYVNNTADSEIDTENDENFDITFKLTHIPDGVDISEYTITYAITPNGSSGTLCAADIAILKGEDALSYSLKNQQKLRISGLPYGCIYKVEERLNNGQNYDVHQYFVDDDDDNIINDKIELEGPPIQYYDTPVDHTKIDNKPVILDVEKKVIIPETAVDDEIYDAIDDNIVQNLEFELEINEASYDSDTSQWEYNPQANKEYTNGSGGGSTDASGKFNIKNDYTNKPGTTQKTDTPELDTFNKQFSLTSDGEHNTKLEITETADDAFTPSYYSKANFDSGENEFEETNDATIELTGNDSFLVKNTLETAALTITKKIDVEAEEDMTFTFEVTFRNVAGHDLTNGTSVTKTVTATIPAGELTATCDPIVGIPVNTVYTVNEVNIPEGYILATRGTDLTGTVSKNGVSVTVENNKQLIEVIMPQTGAVPFVLNFTEIGIFVMSFAGVAVLIYRRKLQVAAVNKGGKGRYMKK